MVNIKASIKVDSYIENWLKKNLGEDGFTFEHNDRSVSILKTLITINTIMDTFGKLKDKDLNLRALEYRSENQSLCQGFPKLDDMPLHSRKYTEILSKLAIQLELKDCSENSYLIALLNLKTERQLIFEEKLKLKSLIDTKLWVKIPQEVTCSKFFKLPSIPTVKNVSENYIELKKKIKSTGINSNFVHRTIVNNSKTKDKIKSNNRLLLHRLSKFERLPLNLYLLENEISSLERHKMKLLREFKESINA